MTSNDLRVNALDEAREKLAQALRGDDTDAVARAIQDIGAAHMETILREYQELRRESDERILSGRGVRQLTGAETRFYQKFIDAAKSANPRQEVASMDAALPVTVVESVMEDLEATHPLLSQIDFFPANGLTELMMSDDIAKLASWGALNGAITTELEAGFKKVAVSIYKLSAYLPVCNAMLDLGPRWLDSYVRRVLREALSAGLEAGVVDGSGKEQPIGMTRQVGEGVTVTSGVYPRKAPIAVRDLSPATVGNLISLLSVAPSGRTRRVDRVLFLVNSQDYYTKVMPATTVMGGDGTYRNDVMPYPMTVIPTSALARNEAVIGLARKYFAPVGMAKDGRIEYSDEYRFLEDERVYRIKLYANGAPKDNNAFLLLNISDLAPAAVRVVNVAESAATVASALASLHISGVALSPAFAPATDSYTGTASATGGAITATPADAAASVSVTVNGAPVNNGGAVTWNDGENAVQVTVNGTDSKTYAVTVTKS